MRRLLLSLALAPSALACGGEEPLRIAARWTHQATGPLAPAGRGPDGRVLVATRGSGGLLRTLEEANGLMIEGPYETFPTDHGPVAVGADLFLVSSVGRLVQLDLAGETRGTSALQLGRTSRLVAAPDGTLRLASTTGRLVAFGPGVEPSFDASFEGAADERLAVSGDGVTFVATDLGRVLGFDAGGQEVFRAQVSAPAAGPSAAGERVAVGEADGVRVFARSGAEVFRRPRAARVVGTRFLEGGDLLAWGEDGRLERLGPAGEVRFTFEAGPPIYADVAPLAGDRFVVFDQGGTAHRLDAEGRVQATYALGGEPLRQISVGATGWLYVTVGDRLLAMDFDADR